MNYSIGLDITKCLAYTLNMARIQLETSKILKKSADSKKRSLRSFTRSEFEIISRKKLRLPITLFQL